MPCDAVWASPQGTQVSAGHKIQAGLSTPRRTLRAWAVGMLWPQGGHTYCEAALPAPRPGPCTCCPPWEPGCPRAHPHFPRPLGLLQSPLYPRLGSTPHHSLAPRSAVSCHHTTDVTPLSCVFLPPEGVVATSCCCGILSTCNTW